MAHWIECEECAGAGFYTCEWCQGTGSTMWDEDEILEGIDKEPEPCYDCLGDGRVDCRPCEASGGWYAE